MDGYEEWDREGCLRDEKKRSGGERGRRSAVLRGMNHNYDASGNEGESFQLLAL